MASIEVSRTLVKSPPELWSELEDSRLAEALGASRVETATPERELAWQSEIGSGTAKLEPTSWGTRVTLTAEPAPAAPPRASLLSRLRARKLPEPVDDDALERRLSKLLDDLGQAHRKPFTRNP